MTSNNLKETLLRDPGNVIPQVFKIGISLPIPHAFQILGEPNQVL